MIDGEIGITFGIFPLNWKLSFEIERGVFINIGPIAFGIGYIAMGIERSWP